MSEVSRLRKTADKICAKMNQMKELTDSELKGKTNEFRMRLKNGETLDQILVDAYAAVGEAAYRTIGLRPYPVQFMGATAMHHGKVVEQNTGEGKAVTTSTLIPTPDGWTLAGEIKVGETMFGRDGKPTKVVGVYPQGMKNIYEVHLADGRVIETADEHLWSVYAAGSADKLFTINTADMLKKGIRSGKAYRYRVPLNNAVEYPKAELPLDPYVLGVYAGLGSYDIPARYSSVAEEVSIIMDADDTFAHEKKYEKSRIPAVYKTASVNQRWALLQGLFDCAGAIENSGSFRLTFQSESSEICDDVREIIFSLGMSCTVNRGDINSLLVSAGHDMKRGSSGVMRIN